MTSRLRWRNWMALIAPQRVAGEQSGQPRRNWADSDRWLGSTLQAARRGGEPFSPGLSGVPLVVVLELVEHDVGIPAGGHDEVLLQGADPELPSLRQLQALAQGG